MWVDVKLTNTSKSWLFASEMTPLCTILVSWHCQELKKRGSGFHSITRTTNYTKSRNWDKLQGWLLSDQRLINWRGSKGANSGDSMEDFISSDFTGSHARKGDTGLTFQSSDRNVSSYWNWSCSGAFDILRPLSAASQLGSCSLLQIVFRTPWWSRGK